MKRIIFLLSFVAGSFQPSLSQVNWIDTTLSFQGMEWNNYSTTYIDGKSDSVPLLVTAIPYNGVYSFGNSSDRSAMDMSFNGSAFSFRSNLSASQQALYTYDSSFVYFLAPGVFRSNADEFEFRVLRDDSSVIKTWSNITDFTDSNFQLNEFRKGFAFLGGYRSSWDHYIVVELRRKKQQQALASTIVYWKQVKPILLSALTLHDLQEVIQRIESPFNIFNPKEQSKWKSKYQPDQLDSITGLPKRWLLPAGERDFLVFLSATIYRKDALEYQLMKNGHLLSSWKPNEVDNNFIWLRDLGPGSYELEIRYRRQRHNVTSCAFDIAPYWFQTLLFKLVITGLTLAFVGFIVLLFKLRRQRKKTAAEQAKHEKLILGLKSVQAQLNPHFIFNALSSIQGLINKNDVPGANRYLAIFGSLVRASLTNSEKQFIPLRTEISILETYLELEKLRFNFSYAINCEEQLPAAGIELPSLLLQPLVENAVKHGVASMHEKGNIRLEFCKRESDLLVFIKDNGQGFVPGLKQEGYGLKLTQDRIRLLNELSEDRIIEMTINSRTSDGTTIELLFKNWLA